METLEAIMIWTMLLAIAVLLITTATRRRRTPRHSRDVRYETQKDEFYETSRIMEWADRPCRCPGLVCLCEDK